MVNAYSLRFLFWVAVGFYGKEKATHVKLPVKTDQDTLREGYRYVLLCYSLQVRNWLHVCITPLWLILCDVLFSIFITQFQIFSICIWWKTFWFLVGSFWISFNQVDYCSTRQPLSILWNFIFLFALRRNPYLLAHGKVWWLHCTLLSWRKRAY